MMPAAGSHLSTRVTHLLAACLLLTACGSTSDDDPAAPGGQNVTQAQPPQTQPAQPPPPKAELLIEDLAVGQGPAAAEGSWIRVHYTGSLPDGTVFDSSRNPGRTPFEIFLPAGVIDGWNRGLIGMKPGGVRRLTIPPHLAYGPVARGDQIGPNSTLIFEIECLAVNQGTNLELGNGIKIQTRTEGTGEPAGFGDWLRVDLMILAGADQRVVFDTRDADRAPIEVSLPAPPGVLKRLSADPPIPLLGAAIYGMRKGEYRIVSLPASQAFGSRGQRLLGVQPGENLTYEIDCLERFEGPVIKLSNGVTVEDLQRGDGEAVRFGYFIRLRYKAMRPDGTVFESNYDESMPATLIRFPWRRPPAVRGWNTGLQGMRVGGIRRLTIPPDLTYRGQPPADSGLAPDDEVTFEIKLLQVQRVKPED